MIMDNPIRRRIAAFLFTSITAATAVASEIDLSTGVDPGCSLIAFGNDDDTWSLVDAPAGVALGPATVVEPSRGHFAALEPDARWISPDADTNEDAPFGPYTFAATFDAAGWTGVEISGEWAADNRLIEIRVNSRVAFTGPSASGAGCPATGCEEFSNASPFLIPATSGLFVSGENTVEVVINNDGPTQGNPVSFVMTMRASEAPAARIVIDPAAYPPGTDLGDQFPGIDLATVPGYVDFVDFDPTPTLVEAIRQTGRAVGSVIASGPYFASPNHESWASDPHFGRFEVFKAAFDFAVYSVTMRFHADDADTGVIGAFDMQGNLLAHEFRRATNTFELTVASAGEPIAYVLAGTSDPAFLGALEVRGTPSPNRVSRGKARVRSLPEYCPFEGGGQNRTGLSYLRTFARYDAGAPVPRGKTVFRFRRCELKFKSTGYEWFLSSRSKSILRGIGTINGLGGFGFQLVTIDADRTRDPSDQDRFRIKIWNTADGEVVYDNDPGAAETFDPAIPIFDGWIRIR